MNINHIIISGNLTRPPEMRSVGADKSVTKFTIANNTKYKNASGELVEKATFLECEAWNKTGEIAAQYLMQGSLVMCEGSLEQENWTDKESGQKRSKMKLKVEKLHLMPRGEKRDSVPVDTAADIAPIRPRAAVAGGADDSNPPFARSDLETA